ncbi:MAG: type II CRISPR-associated endonuclease Cas1 [Christensenellales bacterium]|jgi:CRISPR-associated protein Cas1
MDSRGWRTVIINSVCKLSYKNGYLQVKSDMISTIHLSEIGVLIIESTRVTLTTILLAELSRRKIKVIFCDEKHNPYGELMPYNDRHDSAKMIWQQISWETEIKEIIADLIICQKIKNQSQLLEKYKLYEGAEKLKGYLLEYVANDETNREGHAAKVYFNELFGSDFSRDIMCSINAKLNYGYTILLSLINREVVANGCLTQVGIKHRNQYNPYNFSCDIIEPWRVIVDEYVYTNKDSGFDSKCKYELVNLVNKKVLLDREFFLSNAVSISTKSIVDALNSKDPKILKLYNYYEL